MSWTRVFFAIAMLAIADVASAQSSFTATTTSFTFTFATFEGRGFATAPGADQLDSDDWRVLGFSDGDLPFGSNVNTGDYAGGPSNGNVTTAAVYGFNTGAISTNRIVGVQPTGSEFNPGSIQLRVRNMTGRTIRNVAVAFEWWIFNNEDRSSRNTFRIIRASDGMEIAVAGLAIDTPAARTGGLGPTWVENMRIANVNLDMLPIADGDYIIFSWDSRDLAGMGSRDEFGIDNVTVSLPACGNGMVDASETCDDGDIVTETECPYGTASCMLCSATCSMVLNLTGRVCGDSTRDPEEMCDDGNTTSETSCAYGTPMCMGCRADCQMVLALTGPFCGDSTVTASQEACDDGNAMTESSCPYGMATCMRCDATCDVVLNLTGPVCGDGTTNAGNEACDDGNVIEESACAYGTPSCMGCSMNCQTVLSLTGPYCGDGSTTDGEECDDGNDVDLDGCTSCMLDAMPDAGMPDAGMSDAGMPDAGMPDAGMPDAGNDAGMAEEDAGREEDAGGNADEDGGLTLTDGGMVEEEGGCSCRATQRRSAIPYALVIGIALAILRRRRK